MIIRTARREDIRAIVEIYSLDELKGHREVLTDPLPAFYLEAFDRIASDSNQTLLVAEDAAVIVGSLQMTFISYVLRRAARRALIEAMFVHPSHQQKGVGTALVEEAARLASDAGCVVLHLTSNKVREGAHKFYERLGFKASHEGFQRILGVS